MRKRKAEDLIQTNYPIHTLNREEIDDPFRVIQDFFSIAHLPEVREMLWVSLKTNVTGSFPDGKSLKRKERFDIVFLYEQLLRLVEASHLINEKRILEKYTSL